MILPDTENACGGTDGTNPAAPPKHLYAIVGSPVGHSISPVLHGWGYAVSGHPGAYFAFDKSAAELPAFIAAVRSLPLAGVSVTIPHKEAVIPLLDGLTDRARAVGAVNTLFWDKGILVGDNTDCFGFTAPLTKEHPARNASLPPLPDQAFVLGAGGACRAVLAGLRSLGVRGIRLCARNPEKTASLAGTFSCTPTGWKERNAALADLGPCLVVNTTPLGMSGTYADESPLEPGAFAALRCPADSIAYDIVYTPRETPFLRQAKEQGLRTVDGLPFLVAQGLEQFRIWTGIELDFAEALAFMERRLHKG